MNEPANPENKPGQIGPDDDPKIFNLRNFGIFTIALVGMVVFVLVSSALLSGFFLPGLSVVVTPAPSVAPPAPNLEVYPADEFQSLRATQQAGLDSYGWINRQDGSVRIPIQRAMDLLAQKGLPYSGTPVLTPPAP